MKIAAIIVGIEGWQRFTLPLIESIYEHEPSCLLYIVDNASLVPYPDDGTDDHLYATAAIYRTDERLCYSKAINFGKSKFGIEIDWIIVLSNDVLCTGPFAHILEQLDGSAIVGPQLWHEHGLDWIVGWCVCIPRKIWDAVGGWDEAYTYSSWDDVDVSHSARKKGYALEEHDIPFTHLDQRQRFGLPGYAGSEGINRTYFMKKHGLV